MSEMCKPHSPSQPLYIHSPILEDFPSYPGEGDPNGLSRDAPDPVLGAPSLMPALRVNLLDGMLSCTNAVPRQCGGGFQIGEDPEGLSAVPLGGERCAGTCAWFG